MTLFSLDIILYLLDLIKICGDIFRQFPLDRILGERSNTFGIEGENVFFPGKKITLEE